MRTTQPVLQHSLSSLDELEGVIERVTYHNDENGYSVLRLAVPGRRDLVTVVGTFGNPMVGESIAAGGTWGTHREFGPQFHAERSSVVRPATEMAIQKYLGSGLVKGVGPVFAKRIVGLFGLQTLDVIEFTPNKLRQVAGIGEKRLARIKHAWAEQKQIRQVMLFLQGHGVSATYAVKIYRTYGDEAIHVVETNPYRLAADIWGIGFKTADKIAAALGFLPDSPPRLKAGIIYTLSQATDHGHLFLPLPVLLRSASTVLEVGSELLPEPLNEMCAAEEVIVESAEGRRMRSLVLDAPRDPTAEPPAVYHPALYHSEVGLAGRVRTLVNSVSPAKAAESRVTGWLDYQAGADGLDLSTEQRQAVLLALNRRMLVITGGPGTGKTTVTRLICRAFEARKYRILLAAPTGRAARRLSDVTGLKASTIHRMLKFEPSRRAFAHDESNPLACDVLILDEVSMLDSVLANQLMKAVPNSAQVVLVGDTDQLPSVGAGNVLGDIIASGAAPVCRLTHVFRQAALSLIITNAHRVNRGEQPRLPAMGTEPQSDCHLVLAEDSLEAARTVVQVATRDLPALGFAREEIQVLAPMHRGDCGVAALNELLQSAWNPARTGIAELARAGRTFRCGDRVIQLTNNYEKQVFNGDVGVITKIDTVEQELLVQFTDAEVQYEFAQCDELQLAYALSVHKSQGSEYPAVILPILWSHFMMLQRNLFYTGLTRARKECVIVGDKRAIARAVHNHTATRRFTRLALRLKGDGGNYELRIKNCGTPAAH